jgi:sigma-B regulation protein RsbU (phosphoserine phosphatase)
VIAISIVSFIRALPWIDKPFPGFMTFKFPYVGSFTQQDWPGIKAGLKFMEQIISANGRYIRQGQDLVDLAGEKPPGTLIHYTVESKGEVREIAVPTTKFTTYDFIMVLLVMSIGLALFFLGFIVYLLKPNTASSWVFFFFCVVLGLYLITGFEIQSTYLFVHPHWLLIPLFPAALCHLGLIFPEKKKLLIRYPMLEYGIYLPALIIAIGYQLYLFTFLESSTGISFSWVPDIKKVTSFNRLFTPLCIAGMLLSVLHSMYRASTNIGRQRAKMIIFGVAIGILTPLIFLSVTFFMKIYIHLNLLILPILFFPALIGYSIIRHNLFDADTIIKRTVGYVVVTAVVVGAYAGISVTLNFFMGKYQLAHSQAFPILFTLGVILIFNPLRNHVQNVVDRLFFRKEYDYGEVVDNVSRAITSLLDLGQVLRRLTQTFIEDMFISTTSVMLLDPAAAEYRVCLAEGERKDEVEGKTFRQDTPLIKILETTKREVTKYDVLEDPKYRSISRSCAADFGLVRASLMVPLIFQDKIIGLLNLGDKKSGKVYNRQDIDLLHAVAAQGAVAIENAKLFQENLEKQRMEEELNIARDLQMSMLPASCPQVPGFGIAATSIPAKEVGGDFFDFIEMGEGKMALVVGDVTGKSVSGALVMAASRSIFRMLSEEQWTVADIMGRANRRAKKDIKTGMFVALLYAVLDSKKRTMTLCNAGQTQPIHLSSVSGEAFFVEPEGDRFPLGILEEVEYKEKTVPLSPGDRLVFYTDGIVEAMNAKGEFFGFDRLLHVVREARSLNADGLLKEITKQVNEFCGEAPQSDDLTVIVMSL